MRDDYCIFSDPESHTGALPSVIGISFCRFLSVESSAERASANSWNFFVSFGADIVPDHGDRLPVRVISPRDFTFGFSGLATSTMRLKISLVIFSETSAEATRVSPDFTTSGPRIYPQVLDARLRLRLLQIMAPVTFSAVIHSLLRAPLYVILPTPPFIFPSNVPSPLYV